MARVIVEVNSLQNKDLIGRLVISNAGRDKGSCYVVLESLSDNLLLLVNGSSKTILLPKKKKLKHLTLTNVIDGEVRDSILSQSRNADLIIKRFIKLNGTKEV
ncbi:hypothetical protein [Clostridium sp.]|uniref:hypothetical protein n=1 Tax=Clostridium sp. TaxID=1506 RepID=UPI0039964C74